MGHPLMNDTPKKSNLNDHWKSLDAIFQAQLRYNVLNDDKEKFNALASELGFNDIQMSFLFDSIKTFTEQFASKLITTAYRPLSLTTSPPNNINVNNTNNTNNKPPKKSLYAIPNNKNERLSELKRK